MIRTHWSLVILTMMLVGCAQALPGGTPNPKPLPVDTSGSYQSGSYTLSDAERALDCKKLSGRIQIRLLQIRDSENRAPGSSLSHGAQSVVTPILGGTSYGIDPADTLARDRAVLAAYNAQLKAKGCQTFDLDAELASRDVTHTPRPLPKQ